MFPALVLLYHLFATINRWHVSVHAVFSDAHASQAELGKLVLVADTTRLLKIICNHMQRHTLVITSHFMGFWAGQKLEGKSRKAQGLNFARPA